MKRFAQSLFAYLQSVSQPMLMGERETRELRIFLASFPPKLIHHLGREFSDYLIKAPGKDLKLIFKVGSALWEDWRRSGSGKDRAVLDEIENAGWVDTENRLTHYRNLKLDPDSGKDGLIVMLVGIEQATDQGSLEDFFRVDAETIWAENMKRSFKPWLKSLLKEKQIDPERDPLEQMDKLLQVLHQYYGGDLLSISDFLESVDLNSAQVSQDVLNLLYENLGFWRLPMLKEMKRDWPKYVRSAIDFFSYKPYLKENKRKKAKKKIEQFREQQDRSGVESQDLELNHAFRDTDELLDCLSEYIDKNDPEARQRLLKADFAQIQDKILKFKPPAEIEEEPEDDELEEEKVGGPKILSGDPLQVVLSALWATLLEYLKIRKKKKIKRSIGPLSVQLEGEKFHHDPESEDYAWDLLRGCLGGIDGYLNDALRDLAFQTDEQTEPIQIQSQLENDNRKLGRARNATPYFSFDILFTEEDTLKVRRKFKWPLPETHSLRNCWQMAGAVLEKFRDLSGPCLPLFHIPHYSEIFLAPDEEEANRVLMQGLNRIDVVNLLENENGEYDKNALSLVDIEILSKKYADYLKKWFEKGYFSIKEESRDLIKHMTELMEKVIDASSDTDSGEELAALIYKAYLLTEKPSENSMSFAWGPFVRSAVVTGLHPALMEMLNHRQVFLIHAFQELFQETLSGTLSQKRPSFQTWLDRVDMATVNYPLFGLLTDENKILDTKVEACGMMMHRIGSPHMQRLTLSSRVLQRYEAAEDADIPDQVLFQESRESSVIKNILEEYSRIFPHSQDGLSVMVLNTKYIQKIIAGIDGFLKKVLKERDDNWPPYHFSLSVFMDISESREIARWLYEWSRRWDPAEGRKHSDYYQNCRLSLFQKVVCGREDYPVILGDKDLQQDLAIISRFMAEESKENDLEQALKATFDWNTPLKFPVLEMPRCADDRRMNQDRRARVISNRRFRLATRHSELSARFKHPGTAQDKHHIVVSQGDYSPWREILARLHERVEWVLCLDPCVDERLIGEANQEGHWKREIIGFSSGLGSHGELNYTVSTERSSLKDVEIGIRKQLKRIFAPLPDEELQRSAEFVVREGRRLSGLSLVRATGKGEGVRNLIAFSLVRRCLPPAGDFHPSNTVLCDELLVLDSYRHWFKEMDAESNDYPDLFWVTAALTSDNRIAINVCLFECKISENPSGYSVKARSQVENGLRHLMKRYQNKSSDGNPPFDQRFWWAQLQRLIANKSKINASMQSRATLALEMLGDGDYDISWQAAVLLIDSQSSSRQNQFHVENTWEFESEDLNYKIIYINEIKCNPDLFRRVSAQGHKAQLPILQIHKEKTQDGETVNSHDGEAELEIGPSYSKEDKSPEESEEIPKTEDVPPPVYPVSETYFADTNHQEAPLSERIFLGQNQSGREVFWEFGHPELTNRHLLIFGKSGSGKTYAIQALLYELAMKGQNSLIIDYTNGFLPGQLEAMFENNIAPKTHLVIQNPLPINPFRRQTSMIKGFDPILEKAHEVGSRVTSVINSVYSSIGEQQRAILTETIANGLNKEGDDFDFERMLEALKAEGTSGKALASKLSPLINYNLFDVKSQDNWQGIFANRDVRVHIMQLTSVSADISRIATEFILWDLYEYASNKGRKDQPLPVVLDEIQNLDHRLEAPLGKFLTEGRKFGLSVILATQTLSNLKGEERDRLFQASHKLFFQPAETEVKEYARLLEQSSGTSAQTWISRLNSLQQGECYSLGPALNSNKNILKSKPFKVKIAAFEERMKHEEG